MLAEPIQTVMRKKMIEKPYEKLKELTRGKELGKKEIQAFVMTLKIQKDDKKRLMDLSPEKYIGLAKELVK
jgi:adenylosuccinate lyase